MSSVVIVGEPSKEIRVRLSARLPLRDWVLLPLIALGTVLLMGVLGESVCRLVWQEHAWDSCMMQDSAILRRFRPNCTSRTKIDEGPWIVNHYNECGYPGRVSCGPKPKGSLRIAVVGSSFAAGYMTPPSNVFTEQSARRLESLCHRPVQVQTLAAPDIRMLDIYRRTNEAIKLKPDVIVLSVAPHDLNFEVTPAELAERNAVVKIKSRRAAPISLYHQALQYAVNSRLLTVLEHFAVLDESSYVQRYLAGSKAGYFRKGVDPEWEEHYRVAETLMGKMADSFGKAGIPVILMPRVMRNQAALAYLGKDSDLDAHAFHRMLEGIAQRHGMLYVDTLQPFNTMSSEGLFYPSDTHPNEKGQAVFAELLTKKLLDGSVPAFTSCSMRKGEQVGQ